MFKLSPALLSPLKAERHPVEIILIGFFYTSISLFLSLWIFPGHASLVMIFLTLIPCLYLVQGALILEEKKEDEQNSEMWILKEHSKTLWFFLILFLGFLLPFVFWAMVLPDSIVHDAFAVQEQAYQQIQSITGKITSTDAFSIIFTNNLRVLFLSLLLAIFYGAGAVFILAWNASVMGFVIGSLVRNTLGITSLPYAFLKYFLHGIPEMLAYFAAALAGGILFIFIIKADFEKSKIKKTLIDTTFLIIISVLLLAIAGLIESYISPMI